MEQDPRFFKPWVGQDYPTSPLFGARVLVVGESHYGNEAWNCEESTIDCVKEQVEGLGKKSFWTNIALIFLGNLPTPDDKLAFWNSVAFYNYVQTLVGPASRVRPKREMWPRSRDAFARVRPVGQRSEPLRTSMAAQNPRSPVPPRPEPGSTRSGRAAPASPTEFVTRLRASMAARGTTPFGRPSHWPRTAPPRSRVRLIRTTQFLALSASIAAARALDPARALLSCPA